MATATSFDSSFVNRGFGKLGAIVRGFGRGGFAAMVGSGKVGRSIQPFVAARLALGKLEGRIYAFAADSFTLRAADRYAIYLGCGSTSYCLSIRVAS